MLLFGISMLCVCGVVVFLISRSIIKKEYVLGKIKNAKVLEINTPYIDKNLKQNRNLALLLLEVEEKGEKIIKKKVVATSSIKDVKVGDIL